MSLVTGGHEVKVPRESSIEFGTELDFGPRLGAELGIAHGVKLGRPLEVRWIIDLLLKLLTAVGIRLIGENLGHDYVQHLEKD